MWRKQDDLRSVWLAMKVMKNDRNFVDVILLYTNPCHQYLKCYIFMLDQIPYTRPYKLLPSGCVQYSQKKLLPSVSFSVSELSLCITTSFHVTSAYIIKRDNFNNWIMQYLRHLAHNPLGVHSSPISCRASDVIPKPNKLFILRLQRNENSLRSAVICQAFDLIY